MIISALRKKRFFAILVFALILASVPLSAPAGALGDAVVAVKAIGDTSVVIKADGSLWGWGAGLQYYPLKIMDDVIMAASPNMVIKRDETLWARGYNAVGQLGDGTTINRDGFIKVMDSVASVSAGAYYTAAVKKDGSLYVWGSNTFGKLGDGTTIDRHTPVKIMEDAASVCAGNGHTAAVREDGSLWVWGCNLFGQIGDGTTVDRYVPVKIMDDVISVSLGDECTLAVKRDGSLWAWGRNDNGSLIGDGWRTDQYTPVRIMEDVVSVSAGWNHNRAIKKDGSLWAWGNFGDGQRMDGTMEKGFYAPTRVMDDVVSVSTGSLHTLAIKKDGSLWAWGRNTYGQLGTRAPVTQDLAAPVEIMVTEILLLLDGRVLTPEVPPQIENNRTLVPLRIIVEALGAEVSATANLDHTLNSVAVSRGDTNIVLYIGSNLPTINGIPVFIDQTVIVLKGVTLVPLRFIAESFHTTVNWDVVTRTLNIIS